MKVRHEDIVHLRISIKQTNNLLMQLWERHHALVEYLNLEQYEQEAIPKKIKYRRRKK